MTKPLQFTKKELDLLLQNIDQLSNEEVQELYAQIEELEKRQHRARCRDDLISFCQHMMEDYKVGAHHRHLAKLLTDVEKGTIDRICVNIAPRHGKLLAHSTPVLTTNGWKTHGDLQVGDFVFHPSGEPVEVLAVSDEDKADWIVETSDGEKILCHANHEWAVEDVANKRHLVVETKWFTELAVTGPNAGNPRKLTSGKMGKRGGRYRYQLPAVSAAIFPELSFRRARSIKAVYRSDKWEYGKCIQVDSKDGLYLVGERLIPTHNSVLTSEFYMAWYLGRNPTHQVMLVSHTADLAVDFGRKVRNMVATPAYKEIFPDVNIATDSKSAGRWNTNHGGIFYATGVGSALAGRGAHLLCLTGDSEVKIRNRGITKVKNITVGDEIATISGWEKVTNKWLTIHKMKVKINSVEASLDHPFMTDKGWVCAGDLQLGDRILTQTFWRKLWITASSLLRRLLAKRGKV